MSNNVKDFISEEIIRKIKKGLFAFEVIRTTPNTYNIVIPLYKGTVELMRLTKEQYEDLKDICNEEIHIEKENVYSIWFKKVGGEYKIHHEVFLALEDAEETAKRYYDEGEYKITKGIVTSGDTLVE